MADIHPLPHKNDQKLPKPDWIRVKAPVSREYLSTREIIHDLKLNTVCEEAACPNIGECWSQKHATVMIMGDTCTRACAFCNIKTGVPGALNPHEPMNLAEAVGKLGLKHVVITSVDRDDLEDGGAAHFAECITALKKLSPDTTVEILTPDFLRKEHAIPVVVAARPDVYNHNIETVPRLYKTIRPGARYFNSLHLLKTVKELSLLPLPLGEGRGEGKYNENNSPHPALRATLSQGERVHPIFTKSGLMVGLGETKEEVLQVMDDLRAAEVDFITIGQYLQPTPAHAPVDRYVTPDEFDYYARQARAKGFLMVASSPLTRSSYHADADFAAMRAAREAETRHPL